MNLSYLLLAQLLIREDRDKGHGQGAKQMHTAIIFASQPAEEPR